MTKSYKICLLIYDFLLCDLKIKANIYPNPTAAVIPADVAVNPPLNIPKIPNSFTASIAPLARDAPKPIMGTVIPDFANSFIGSNNITACKKTPISSNKTSILAEVILVLIIKIWASKHTKPPTPNTIKYCKKVSILFPLFYNKCVCYTWDSFPLLS